MNKLRNVSLRASKKKKKSKATYGYHANLLVIGHGYIILFCSCLIYPVFLIWIWVALTFLRVEVGTGLLQSFFVPATQSQINDINDWNLIEALPLPCPPQFHILTQFLENQLLQLQ